jgi:HlyD family secretion protein
VIIKPKNQDRGSCNRKKKWNRKRILSIAGVAALVLLVTFAFLFTSGKSRLNVDTERITVSEIRKGNFQEFIPVNGAVQPITTIYLDAIEGGRVEERLVEDGAVVKKASRSYAFPIPIWN